MVKEEIGDCDDEKYYLICFLNFDGLPGNLPDLCILYKLCMYQRVAGVGDAYHSPYMYTQQLMDFLGAHKSSDSIWGDILHCLFSSIPSLTYIFSGWTVTTNFFQNSWKVTLSDVVFPTFLI
jgi:hypothetical protein